MSVMTTSNAWPPPDAGASDMCTLIASPGFMSSVLPLGTKVVRLANCGDGGPVGTPSFWMKAKLTGSTQAGSAFVVGVPVKLSMFSAAHQCVPSQLSLSAKGALPGGYSCISMNAEPPPWVVGPHLTPAHVGALESEFGVQAVPGEGVWSHRAMENHGAGLSSNHFERSDSGCEFPGGPLRARPRV